MTLPFAPIPSASYAWDAPNGTVYTQPYRIDAVPGRCSISGAQVASVVARLGLRVVAGAVPTPLLLPAVCATTVATQPARSAVAPWSPAMQPLGTSGQPPERAKRVVLVHKEGPAFDVDAVYCMDLFDLVNALAPQSVDMILADLPYGTTACSWDEVIPFEPMWAAFKRVIRPRGAIVLTASQPFTSRLVCSNLGMFKCEWIWRKNYGSNFGNTDYQPMKEHESVLVFGRDTVKYFPQEKARTETGAARAKYAINPSPKKREFLSGYMETAIRWNNPDNRVPSSVLDFNCERGLHPTQKPLDLFKYLIRTYTQPGDVVLDPVCGSGTTAVAARATNRRYICGDISQEYVSLARERLRLPFEAHHVVRETNYDGLPLFATAVPT